MLLRHLIVLIINVRNVASALLKNAGLSSDKNEMPRLSAWRILIGQIKLTRIHVASLLLPGVRVKRCKKPSLYDVERSGRIHSHKETKAAKLALCVRR